MLGWPLQIYAPCARQKARQSKEHKNIQKDACDSIWRRAVSGTPASTGLAISPDRSRRRCRSVCPPQQAGPRIAPTIGGDSYKMTTILSFRSEF